jgi:hypothetical protein
MGSQSAFEYRREITVADAIDPSSFKRREYRILKHRPVRRGSCITPSRLPAGSSDQMRKELGQRLVERWPTWFNTGGDIRHTLMSRGLTHGDGWFDIVWRLCEDLESLVTEVERTGRKQVDECQRRYGPHCQNQRQETTLRTCRTG